MNSWWVPAKKHAPVWEYHVTEAIQKGRIPCGFTSIRPLAYIRQEFDKCPTRGSEDAMDGFVHIRKAHCMFGWDWGAHLPDAGIFRPVYLCYVKKRFPGRCVYPAAPGKK